MKRPILKEAHKGGHADYNDRLSEMGMELEDLIDPLRKGILARGNSTPLHPPISLGLIQWGETVVGLREKLIPKGWTSCDYKNYSRIISPDKKRAIVPIRGCQNTGLEDKNPTNKTPKGSCTRQAIMANPGNLQLRLPLEKENLDYCETWMLMSYVRSGNVIQLELSLPNDMSQDGYINSWHQRILLPEQKLDETIDLKQDFDDDIEIEISRKAFS
jgi:hypothetical protein